MGKAVGSIVLNLVQSIAAIPTDRKGPSKACGGAEGSTPNGQRFIFVS